MVRRRRRTHCIRGHRLTKANIYAYDRGGRVEHKCKECDRLRHRTSKEKGGRRP